jgi:UrcA family protein
MFSNTLRTARNAFLVALATAAACGATTAVQAAPNDAEARIAVDYTDLDLTTSAGIETLYHRIVEAARRVCPQTNGPAALAVKSRIRECREAAIADAVAQINDPRLAAVHAVVQRRG